MDLLNTIKTVVTNPRFQRMAAGAAIGGAVGYALGKTVAPMIIDLGESFESYEVLPLPAKTELLEENLESKFASEYRGSFNFMSNHQDGIIDTNTWSGNPTAKKKSPAEKPKTKPKDPAEKPKTEVKPPKPVEIEPIPAEKPIVYRHTRTNVGGSASFEDDQD